MANIASSKKRALQSVKRRAHNRSLSHGSYTVLKKAYQAIQSGNSDAQQATSEAISRIAKMVPKGVFHKNKASRLISRLNAALKEKARDSQVTN